MRFRYSLPRQKNDNPKAATIFSEASSFNFPDSITTTFLCPQAKPMSGWQRTKPSYEEEYTADAPMDTTSLYGVGYTFPCLFHVGDRGWALVSETGVDGNYVGSRLSDYSRDNGYTIAFPQTGENNGNGSPYAAVATSRRHAMAHHNPRHYPQPYSRDHHSIRSSRTQI